MSRSTLLSTTCYRVELYAFSRGGVEEAREELIGVLAGTHGVERSLLVDHLYVHAGEDVARHLSRVSTGLDSLVLGEAEILGQVGDAFEHARDAATAGPALDAALPDGYHGRAARALRDRHRREPGDRELDGAGARRRRARRSPRRDVLLVVGAGRIALQTLKAATGRGVTEAAVANRTASSEPGGGRARSAAQAYGLEELEHALAWADVVVTATSARRARPERRNRAGRDGHNVPTGRSCSSTSPFPADVERTRAEIDGVSLFDVDDLRAGLDDAIAVAPAEVPSVEAIVEEEVEGFGRRYRELRGRAARRRASGGRPRRSASRRSSARFAISARRRPGDGGADRASLPHARQEAPARAHGPPARAGGRRGGGRRRRCRSASCSGSQRAASL